MPRKHHPIEGFPGYTFRDDHTVWSHKRKKVRQLTVRDEGYFTVYLMDATGVQRRVAIHHLVLSCIKKQPKPFKGAHARHLNDVKHDNRPENLEWGTRSENMHDMYRNGRKNLATASRACPTRQLSDEQVTTLRREWRKGKKSAGRLSVEFANAHGYNNQCVYKAIRGETFKHLPL